MAIVFMGTMDDDGDTMLKLPQVELWIKDRVNWLQNSLNGEVNQFNDFP